MKKILGLITLIGMIGVYAVGCGSNNDKQLRKEETVGEVNSEDKVIDAEEKDADDVEEVEIVDDAKVVANEESNDTQEIVNETDANKNRDEEQVIYDFFETMKNGDIEKARQYVLYDDLEAPFYSLESTKDYYVKNKLFGITKMEDVSDDLKLVYLSVGTDEASAIEDSYMLKKDGNDWLILINGVMSWEQSVYEKDQFEDGSVAVYLKDIYHWYNGKDVYVIGIANNTNKKFNYGFVNYGGVIYEFENNKKEYLEMKQLFVTEPYSFSYIYFSVDAAEGPIKSITLTETMLGLQSKTGEVQVLMGEMIEK